MTTFSLSCLALLTFLALSNPLVSQQTRQLAANPPAALAINSPICQTATALGCDFIAWKAQFQKSYPTIEEDEQRHLYFCQNCTFINSDHGSYTMKLNEWSASTLAQVERHYGLRNQNLTQKSDQVNQRVQQSMLNIKVGVSIPTNLDYRSYNGQNYVTSVKNQGSCGCCWSFGATGQYESYLKLNGFNYDLSAEAALQCTSFYAPNKRVSDCSGGYFPDPFYYLAEIGSLLDSSYPYVAGNYGSGSGYPSTPGICMDENRIFLGNGTVNLYAPLIASGGLTVTQIKTLLVTDGPLMIGLYANPAFNSYSSGTFTGCPSNAVYSINHAILLIGWTSTGWIAKNQWGTAWGNAGYIEIDFTLDCGLRFLMGGVSVANKNTNVQVVMSTGYVAWEQSLTLSLLLAVIMMTFLV